MKKMSRICIMFKMKNVFILALLLVICSFADDLVRDGVIQDNGLSKSNDMKLIYEQHNWLTADSLFTINDFLVFTWNGYYQVKVRLTNNTDYYMNHVRINTKLYYANLPVREAMRFYIWFGSYGQSGMSPKSCAYVQPEGMKVLPSGFDKVEVTVEWEIPDGTEDKMEFQALQLVSSTFSGHTENKEWTGTIKNVSLTPINRPVITAVFYKNGEMKNFGIASANAPQNTWPFLLPSASCNFSNTMVTQTENDVQTEYDKIEYILTYDIVHTGKVTMPTNSVHYADEIKLDYQLYNNHPNPFNNSTEIKFEILIDSFVDISALNLRGEEVDKIYSRFTETGTHVVTWQADDLPSGQYFIVMQANGLLKSIQCTIVK